MTYILLYIYFLNVQNFPHSYQETRLVDIVHTLTAKLPVKNDTSIRVVLLCMENIYFTIFY